MKILLEAPILTQSGYGEHSRLVLSTISSIAGADIYINALNWGTTSWTSNIENKEFINECIRKFAFYTQRNENAQFDVQIHVGIPGEFSKKAPYSVCVTAGTETTAVSSDWILKTHQGIDKIIVPSEHSKQSFVNTFYPAVTSDGKEVKVGCRSEVEVVPYPVKVVNSKQLDLSLETSFNFLSVAMWGIRKNLENMVRWFVAEFKENSDVGLVLKTNLSQNSVMDRERTKKNLLNILNTCDEHKCRIYLLHGDLDEEQVHSLYENESIKAYISTTHGEGYGLPIFEAAYSGLPIIATNWSGHLDFLSAPVLNKKTRKIKQKQLFAKVDYDLKKIQEQAVWQNILIADSKWAFPKEVSFRAQMRKVYSSLPMYSGWAKKLKDHLLQTHTQEKVKEAMLSALAIEPEEPEMIDWMASQQEVEKL